MLAKTFSATHFGLEGTVIQIEGALQRALPKIHITGLPGDVIRESSDRVKACLVGLGFDVPSSRLVIHLSPAQARKQGSQLDLAIALAVLKTEGFLRDADLSHRAFLGELSLDGRLHRVNGMVALLQVLEGHCEIDTIVIPSDNAWEAGLLDSRKARLAGTLVEVLDFIGGKAPLRAPPPLELPMTRAAPCSLDHVIGQGLAKRALQIALAGQHHLLFIGPPGVGKSLLAGCAPDLLPPLEKDEWIVAAKARGPHHSSPMVDRRRPFRSPHHTVSGAALLGGGSGTVIPGEVTLAHSGVLFLDEFPEFRRDVIEGLREPLQNGVIHLHRIGHALSLPARFTLIAAMNPCPCGYSMGSSRRCVCSLDRLMSYRRKISGPILDRIDLCVLLTAPQAASTVAHGPSHREVATSIERAWAIQRKRYEDCLYNGACRVAPELPWFALGEEERTWLDRVSLEHELNYRSLHKVVRVARTLADLETREHIAVDHLREAWGLRCPEYHSLVYN